MDETKDASIGDIAIMQDERNGVWRLTYVENDQQKTQDFEFFYQVSRFVEGELLSQ